MRRRLVSRGRGALLKIVCFLECFLQSNPNRIRIARCEKSCEGRWLREIFRSRERQFNKGRGDRRFGLRRRGAGAPAFATSMCGTRGGHLATIRRKNAGRDFSSLFAASKNEPASLQPA